jgi:hypothetical protein
VIEGLSDGERVATTQVARLESGVKVRVASGPAGQGGAGAAQ